MKWLVLAVLLVGCYEMDITDGCEVEQRCVNNMIVERCEGDDDWIVVESCGDRAHCEIGEWVAACEPWIV